MAKKNIEIPKDNNIIKAPISEVMPENYLPYAVEVAKERALPDVRDGLKPVHRRILYGTYKLKAMPDKPYYKSARIVGDILGKYHPHGDSSVYEAMVILAQDFTTRVPLIDGHGNWGSADGDNAAAMRYTEARFTNAATEMLRDIDKDVVDMVNNYSDTELEPKVLPARFPNLLVNGVFGIAVGLATNIPPHNLRESIDACIAYIDNKDITTRELMNYIKGPDLPTGGIIIGEKALLAAYETGEGRVTLRAKTSIEELENGRYGIIIKEFPYRKNKSKILQNISEMTADKKHSKALESIADIRDESDRNGIRAVIEFKKSIDKDVVNRVLKYLLKKTELQCNLSFNMVAIADGKPKTLSLREIVGYYIKHQKEVVTRRSRRELQIAKTRFEIIEGFIKAIDIMDEIIAVIRASKSKKDSENNIIDKFKFSSEQAQAIVELMLYKLTTLEINVFQKEYKNLEKQIKSLEKILSSDKELFKVVKKELKEVKEKYGDNRRSQIIHDDNSARIELEEIILDEDIVITISNEGYIKRVGDKYYKRFNATPEDIEYREGDFNRYILNSNTKYNLTIFTDKGNMYKVKCFDIPEMKWKEKGERLDSIVKTLNLEIEKIVKIYVIKKLSIDKKFIFFTSKGIIKKTSLNKFETNYSKLLALKLKEDEKLIDVKIIDEKKDEKYMKIETKNGLKFILDEPKIEDTDRNIKGTQAFNLSKQDQVTSIEYVDKFQMKNFIVNIDKEGYLKISDKKIYKNNCNCYTNSLSKLIIFGSMGNVYLIPSYMMQNIDGKSMNLGELIDEFIQGKEKIISIFSLLEFSEEISAYFFTKFGYIKRTILNEFSGDYSYWKGYKFKNEEDELIDVKLGKENISKDIVLITKNAMGIRFDAGIINPMGKITTGVTGISLKEEDEVIFSDIITEDKNNNEIKIISNNKVENKIFVKDIKNQNRAGKGKKLLSLKIDDYISCIKNSNK